MDILIAEDDPVSRRLLESTLGRWQYRVLSACDGEEAWRVLERPDAPRLAILDWMMPGISGPSLCRELRVRKKEPYTYVLLLTSRSQKRDLVEGMEAGADDYIIKPFEPEELKARLRAGRRILELQAELVRAREALREQATRDPLTLMWNRSSIMENLEREVAKANREHGEVALAMADLDHFKEINDSHGHIAGDAVLREVARRMKSSVRSYDAVGRYGGEEFLIVLPGAAAGTACQLAERLRAAIGGEPLPFSGEVIRFSVSLGVSASTPGHPVRPEALLRAADAALYRAKRLGRDRVEYELPSECELVTC